MLVELAEEIVEQVEHDVFGDLVKVLSHVLAQEGVLLQLDLHLTVEVSEQVGQASEILVVLVEELMADSDLLELGDEIGNTHYRVLEFLLIVAWFVFVGNVATDGLPVVLLVHLLCGLVDGTRGVLFCASLLAILALVLDEV